MAITTAKSIIHLVTYTVTSPVTAGPPVGDRRREEPPAAEEAPEGEAGEEERGYKDPRPYPKVTHSLQ